MSPTVPQQFYDFEKPPTFSHDSSTIRKCLTVESTRLVGSPLQFAYSSPTVLTLGQKNKKGKILTDDQMLGIRFFCWVSLRLSRSPSWNGCRLSGGRRADCRRLCSFGYGRGFGFVFGFCRFSPVVALFLLGSGVCSGLGCFVLYGAIFGIFCRCSRSVALLRLFVLPFLAI